MDHAEETLREIQTMMTRNDAQQAVVDVLRRRLAPDSMPGANVARGA
jgi:hypothetical protein